MLDYLEVVEALEFYGVYWDREGLSLGQFLQEFDYFLALVVGSTGLKFHSLSLFLFTFLGEIIGFC